MWTTTSSSSNINHHQTTQKSLEEALRESIQEYVSGYVNEDSMSSSSCLSDTGKNALKLSKHGSSTAEEDCDTSSSGGTGSAAGRETNERLGAKETKAVTWSRILMLLVLFGLAALAATAVYKYTTTQEASDFEVRVSFLFSIFIESFHQSVLLVLVDAMELFAKANEL